MRVSRALEMATVLYTSTFLASHGLTKSGRSSYLRARPRTIFSSHTGSGRWTRIEDSWVVEQRVGWCAMSRGGEPWRGLLHLSVEDLEARLRSAQDPTATRHVQVIWLLARGHTIADVAAVTSFVPRWIEQLLARYNAHGPEALGDLRRRNGSAPSVLRPELLARLPERLATPPSDGGLWT